jgi:acetyltransferase EpsM
MPSRFFLNFSSSLLFSFCFWDDDETISILNYTVERRMDKVPKNNSIIIGIGANSIREKISLLYSRNKFISLIHPSSVLTNQCSIGIGSVIMPGVCINNGVTIGDHCIINTGVVIEHDCSIDNYVHVSPNATICGNVNIGIGTWIGAGAVIIQGVCIGRNVKVGAGAIIISNVPDNVTVVGNPGKIINT